MWSTSGVTIDIETFIIDRPLLIVPAGFETEALGWWRLWGPRLPIEKQAITVCLPPGEMSDNAWLAYCKQVRERIDTGMPLFFDRDGGVHRRLGIVEDRVVVLFFDKRGLWYDSVDTGTGPMEAQRVLDVLGIDATVKNDPSRALHR